MGINRDATETLKATVSMQLYLELCLPLPAITELLISVRTGKACRLGEAVQPVFGANIEQP